MVNLSKAVYSMPNLEAAWRVIYQNGRSSSSDLVKLELDKFAEDPPKRIRSLKYRLSRNKFSFEPAKGIPIPKIDVSGRKTGKYRPIVLAPVESRIVQRAILNVLVKLDDLRPYSETPYSFGGIRKVRLPGQARSESPSAVPAAIRAVLDSINDGSKFVICADIQAFFTRISKPIVTETIGKAVNDFEFMRLFEKAITTELSNLVQLRELGDLFPIQDIGVAQGNSLSPLLGNIILSDFDKLMNEGDCRCIRYIDDFIILAPTLKAANAKLRKAISLLSELGMQLSPDKSGKGGSDITKGFDFLGINISPGLVRPSVKSSERFISSVRGIMEEGKTSLRLVAKGGDVERNRSFLGTLKRLDGTIDGWGKHYWFCSDRLIFQNLDAEIGKEIASFIGCYSSIKADLPTKKYTRLLGIAELANQKREPFGK